MPKCNRINVRHALWDYPERIWWKVGCLLRLCQVQDTIRWGNICWLSWQTTVDRYEHQDEGMTLVIKAQEVSFSTIGNVHLTPLNDKSQVVLELVSPITLWILWKQRCRQVFSNQTTHPTMLMQEIWSEIIAIVVASRAAPMDFRDND